MTAFFIIFSFTYSPETPRNQCIKGRKCSKEKGHIGKCNAQQEMKPFWKRSPVYDLCKKRQGIQEQFDKLAVKEDNLNKKEAELSVKERQIDERSGKLLSRLAESGKTIKELKI